MFSLRGKSVGEPLRAFWSELRGTRHPSDEDILRQFEKQHTLQLQYPPPAFIGDIINARVFILYANGGFDEEDTGEEFNHITTGDYRERLHNPRPCDNKTHPYWLSSKAMALWLRAGNATVINAMAYRSRKLSEEPENQKLTNLLPSVARHRDWLRTHLLPAAADGKVFVHIHRWRSWGLDKGEHESSFVKYSDNPGYRYMSDKAAAKIHDFLDLRV